MTARAPGTTPPGMATAPWPALVPPPRASHDDFGQFVDTAAGQLVAGCRERRLPAIIAKAVGRCVDHYWLRGGRLRRLRHGTSVRQKRTERRCAHVVVLMYLLTRVDLSTLQCITPSPAGFIPVPVATVAACSGLALRRTERVLADLSRAGYLRTEPRHEKIMRADGTVEIVNQIAVRWLTRNLFEDLGLLRLLDVERTRAKVRQIARGSGLVDVAQLAGRRSRPKRKATGGRVSQEEVEANRLIGAVLLDHPGWSHDACRAEARRRARRILGVDPPS